MITELPQDGEKRLLEGTTKLCVHQEPGERKSVPLSDCMTLKDELPRFVEVNMLLVKSGEITAERMKRWSHKSQATVSVQESLVVLLLLSLRA